MTKQLILIIFPNLKSLVRFGQVPLLLLLYLSAALLTHRAQMHKPNYILEKPVQSRTQRSSLVCAKFYHTLYAPNSTTFIPSPQRGSAFGGPESPNLLRLYGAAIEHACCIQLYGPHCNSSSQCRNGGLWTPVLVIGVGR